jgi:hypothetical protein
MVVAKISRAAGALALAALLFGPGPADAQQRLK